jgi:hypothetical protein
MKELKDRFKNWKSAKLTPQPTFVLKLSLSHLESEREKRKPHSVYATTRYGPNSLNISLIL